MELTTIRELYKNRDSYMDQKVTIGGWVRSCPIENQSIRIYRGK